MTRTSLILLFVLFALLAAPSCSSPADSDAPADLVLRGGKIVTVDPRHPEAHAVAVRDGRFVAVGSDADIDALVGEATRVVELGGRLVVPGFIEGHGHFLGLGNAKMILDLTGVRSWDEIVAMVGEAAAAAEPGTWIRGRGWHQEKWDSVPSPAVDGAPVHASLSAVSPENPVMLTHASGHASFVNARALELGGIGRATADPPGGTIVRDSRGRASGMLRETAQRLVGSAFSQAQEGRASEEVEAELRRQVQLAGEEALSKGVTSFQDAGSSFAVIDFLRKLEDEGALPVRMYVMVRGASNEEMAEKLAAYRSPADGNDFLAVRGIKRQIDGALGSHGAWLLEPYADLADSTGLVLEPEAEIRRTAELAVEHGYQVNTHAIGDRANRAVLDIYEEVWRAAGVDDTAGQRWRIEHAQHLHPDDVGRFAELGVVASMQAVHCTSDGPWVPKRVGEERAASGAYLWRTLLDRGVVVSNGTDVPVEDIDPIPGFHALVSRIMGDGSAFYPDERLTREEALRAYTLSGAFAAFEENDKGSIEPGKLADLVVLSHDIMTVPLDEIPTAEVVMTIVGGEVRWTRN